MRITLLKYLFIFILFIETPSLLCAATYYIKPNGNDNLSGLSIGKAWQSIAKVNATVFYAGDTILFEGGGSFNGNITLNSGSGGTIKKPLIISTYGSGKASIYAGNGNGFYAYNTAGIAISNLIFTGSGYTINSGVGVYFFMDKKKNVKLKYLLMENLEVTGFRTSGIQISSWPTDSSRSGFDTVIIKNCIAHDNGLSGISVSGYYSITDTFYSHKHLLISGCKAYNNYGLSGYSTNSGNGIIIGQADTCIMQYCEAYENGKNNDFAGGGPAGIWAWDSKNVIIQYCYSHHNRSKTLDGDGFDLDGGVRNSIMQYNYSHDNDGPGFLIAQYTYARKMKNIAVRYNISERDGKGLGALIWNGDPAGTVTAEKIDVYNNTIYTDTIGNTFANAAIAVMNNYGATKDIRICNNIFITKNNAALVDISRCLNLKFYNNAYFDNGNGFKYIDNGTTYNSINTWRGASGQEVYNGKSTGFKLDPLLYNPGNAKNISGVDSLKTLKAYRYKNTSLLIGKGIVIDSLLFFNNLLTDYFDDTIAVNNQYSPGAHEIDAPKAQFSTTNNCQGITSKIINRSLKSISYLWDFGDGSTSTSYTPIHIYSKAGIYSVLLKVTGKFGYIDSIRRNIEIYNTPSAKFTINGNSCEASVLSFSNSGNPSSTVFLWRFDDSTIETKPQIDHVFKYSGIHQIKFNTLSPQNCKDSSVVIQEIFRKPFSNFSINNYCQGDSKLFTNKSDGDSSYQWDFGDSAISTLKNPTHKYQYSGSKAVTLIIQSNHFCFDTVTKSLEIFKKPSSYFSVMNHCFGDTMPIINLSINDSVSFWDFGEGTVSNNRNPKVIGKTVGKKTIQLKTISKNNCSDTMEQPVTIFALPDASYTYKRAGDSFYFKAKDTLLANYQWRINGKISSIHLPKLNLKFSANGFQKVSLKATNNNCSDSTIQSIDYSISGINGIISNPAINVFPNPYSENLTVQFLSKIQTPVNISITDLQGKIIYVFNIPAAAQTIEAFELNSREYPLAPGVYQIMISTPDFKIVKKIIRE